MAPGVGADTDGLRSAWETFLAAECKTHPLVIVLEDLHAADARSIEWLVSALRRVRGRPVFTLALARPELHHRFPGFAADADVQELRLGALTKKVSERLVAAALDEAVDAERLASIVDRGDGTPTSLEALALASEEVAAPWPAIVIALGQARLDELHADARRVLRVASLFGESFPLHGIVDLIGDEESVSAWISQLEDRFIVSRGDPKSDVLEYAFVSPALRASVEASLIDSDRKLGRELAMGWRQRTHPTQTTGPTSSAS